MGSFIFVGMKTTLWMTAGSCSEYPPAVFFPSTARGVDIARKICLGCPVRSECLQYALDAGWIMACGVGCLSGNVVSC